MNNFITSESNRLKQEAGKDQEKQLTLKFKKLEDTGIIESFQSKVNFNHRGYTYNKQYLANFILRTLDDKFIVINSSNSFRNDRVKIQNWDLLGIKENANISSKVIASILLYPDNELDNSTFNNFRSKVLNNVTYTPATHILVLSELLEFLENHQAGVESELEELEKESAIGDSCTNSIEKIIPNMVAENQQYYLADSITLFDNKSEGKRQIGSHYGKAGNKLEKIIVNLLNDRKLLQEFKLTNGKSPNSAFNTIISTIANSKELDKATITNIRASNQIIKLKNGGSAKTDVRIDFSTVHDDFTETLSIKNTKQSNVSCHDYSANDFLRVLNCADTKLGKYFKYFQEAGSHKSFETILPQDFTIEEFTQLLAPKARILTEWACTGRHDHHNLIDSALQTSNYILINKEGDMRMTLYDNYIDNLFKSSKLTYGIPLGWTYPSKQRGKRIQFKLPITY